MTRLNRMKNKYYEILKSEIDEVVEEYIQHILSESLDVSIKHLNKEIDTIQKASNFISKKLHVEEKIDGTKLILVRKNTDSSNYSDNWIVSYKGNILHPEEFEHFNEKDIKDISSKSIGISQYKNVFEKLKKINDKISLVPKNTAFSLEFAQNKDTLTRTYVTTQALFLRSFANVKYYVNDGFLTISNTSGEITDFNSINDMARILDIYTFPVILDGYINTRENFISAIKSDELLGIFNKTEINFDDSLDIISKFSKMMVSFSSKLGGKPEGVVIHTSDNKLYKVTQSDQYDLTVRSNKKLSSQMDAESEKEYQNKISELARGFVDRLDFSNSVENLLKTYNDFIKKVDLEKIHHSKKSRINKIDDLMLAGKFLIQRYVFSGRNTKTLGLVPMAAKPVHLGHWKLIQLASKENNNVIVYISEKDRIKKGEYPITGNQMVQIWNEILKRYLPNNVKIKFVDSPVSAVRYMLLDLDKEFNESPIVNIYSDIDDINSYNSEEFKSKYKNLFGLNKIKLRGIERSHTVDISGTKMREFLQNDDKLSFTKNLPDISDLDKEKIYNLIKNISRSKTLNESGQSIASIDPKTPKTVNGKTARADKKLNISGGNRTIISDHIRDLAITLNKHINFWNPNNPYIKNGYIFNGSSQHLMNPDVDDILRKKTGDPDISLEKIKSDYGDIDIIVPITKLDELKKFLDTKDDNKSEWEPGSENKITNQFFYVGRTKSAAAIPDQLVTIFWYKPNNQIVQVDFEGDNMVKDQQGYEKPSEWTKFSKDSPLDDLAKGIKGLAGAILLRSLARGTTRLENVIVLTAGGVKKYKEKKEITDREISKNKRDAIPSEYTLNTGGGGAGIRKAYNYVGKINNKDAYEFVEARAAKDMGEKFVSITNLSKIFEIIFKKSPTSDDLNNFRSFQGLLKMMRDNLDKKTINIVLNRFVEIIKTENISSTEKSAIEDMIKSTLA